MPPGNRREAEEWDALPIPGNQWLPRQGGQRSTATTRKQQQGDSVSPLSLHTGLFSYPWRTEKVSGAPTLVHISSNIESTRHTKEDVDQPDSFHIPVHCAPPPPGQAYRSTQILSAWIGQAMTFLAISSEGLKPVLPRVLLTGETSNDFWQIEARHFLCN